MSFQLPPSMEENKQNIYTYATQWGFSIATNPQHELSIVPTTKGGIHFTILQESIKHFNNQLRDFKTGNGPTA